jgi:hypothetical protein
MADVHDPDQDFAHMATELLGALSAELDPSSGPVPSSWDGTTSEHGWPASGMGTGLPQPPYGAWPGPSTSVTQVRDAAFPAPPGNNSPEPLPAGFDASKTMHLLRRAGRRPSASVPDGLAGSDSGGLSAAGSQPLPGVGSGGGGGHASQPLACIARTGQTGDGAALHAATSRPASTHSTGDVGAALPPGFGGAAGGGAGPFGFHPGYGPHVGRGGARSEGYASPLSPAGSLEPLDVSTFQVG